MLPSVAASLTSLSAVPGGVCSCVGKSATFGGFVRRCRVRYDADRGSSGLLEAGAPGRWLG
jgi:hypothetical protein